jgi:hypothetical protein
MKARFIKACQGSNPGFDRSQPESADNPRIITHQVGAELDHPQAWVHCLPNAAGNVLCEPADDECAAVVTRQQELREQKLSRMSAKTKQARETLKQKMPTLNDDGSNGPSPQTKRTKK